MTAMLVGIGVALSALVVQGTVVAVSVEAISALSLSVARGEAPNWWENSVAGISTALS